MLESIEYNETAGYSIGTAGDTWTAATCPSPFTFSAGSCYQSNFSVVSNAQKVCNAISQCKGFDIDTTHNTLYIKTIGPPVDKLVAMANVDAYVQVKRTNWLFV